MKTIRLLDKLVFSKNDSRKLASSKNDSSKPVYGKNNNNNEIGFGDNNIEYVKKSRKLKNQNWAQLKKNLLKNRNLHNHDAIEIGPKFLISNTRTAFNYL